MGFWHEKSLAEMSHEEWEALCDGCGKCCLVKLEDEDSGLLFHTSAVCRFYDQQRSCCSIYSRRSEEVADCVHVSLDEPESWRWLPSTCSYRLLAEGKPLPEWHYLVCGDRQRVHELGMSIRGRAVSETAVHPDQLQDMIVRWVDSE